MAGTDKAVILAAGLGSRLGPELAEHPKALLTCAGVPILSRSLAQLAVLTDISDVAVVVGHRGEDVMHHLRQSQIAGLNLHFCINPEFAVSNSMYSLSLVREFAEDGFYLVDGDVLLSDAALLMLGSLPTDSVLVDTSRPVDQIDMRVEIMGDRIWHMAKDLPLERTKGEFFGVSRLGPEAARDLFREIAHYLRSHGRSDWYELALREIAKRRAIRWYPIDSDQWFEIDTATDYGEAQRWAARHPSAATSSSDRL